jgi:hypothetical protein
MGPRTRLRQTVLMRECMAACPLAAEALTWTGSMLEETTLDAAGSFALDDLGRYRHMSGKAHTIYMLGPWI